MKEQLEKLVKWICMGAYWVFPCIYLMVSCTLNALGYTGFNFYGLLSSVLLGIICHFAAKSWLEGEFDDDVIDFAPKKDEEDTEKSFFRALKEMPQWEQLLWFIVLCFFGITWWVMVKGLGVLFVGGVTPFVYVFSTIVVLTMLWLVMMISVMIRRKKSVIGFIVLYIVFDAMSAFSFNFVEFYDNVSSTQHMDRDMKDCRRFSDIQGQYIAQVKDYVDELHNTSAAEAAAQEKKKASAEKDAQQLRTEAKTCYYWDDMQRMKKEASKKDGEASECQSSINKASSRMAYADGLKTRVDSMSRYKEKLDALTAKYRNDKQHFVVKDWQASKDLAQQIEATLVNLSADQYLKDKVQLDTTEVAQIMRHLKSDDQDRFASLNKLFQAIASLFHQDGQLKEPDDAVQYSDLLATTDTVVVKPAPVVKPAVEADPISEDQKFENRLLYMSIMLSILIDVLPLLLGILVARIRPR